MNVWLLFRDRDVDRGARLPAHAQDLVMDLGLEVVLAAMADGDAFVFDVTRTVLLTSLVGDRDAIRYRQDVLRDCLAHAAAVRAMYDLAVAGVEAKKRHWYFSVTSRFPGNLLAGGVELMTVYARLLRRLRGLTDPLAAEFHSDGLRRLCAMLATELSDEYFARVDRQLDELELRDGVLVGCELGGGVETTNEILYEPPSRPGWLGRWLGRAPAGYTVKLGERDEPSARALGRLRDAGINRVANALAQSVDHVERFFALLRAELAFYLGCLNLHTRLAVLGLPTCEPEPAPLGSRTRNARGLYEPALALERNSAPVTNDLAADGAGLVVITGANQGGKTTFLRALGLAQLMMQAGMFACANSFSAEIQTGLFTHFKREEDAALERGKLDEELHRLSALIDATGTNALVLFNESFASTNEREGSEIAREITRALIERHIAVAFVTHLYDFARGAFVHPPGPAVFLRAERRADASRPFKLVPGEPLATSFGLDLYTRIFDA